MIARKPHWAVLVGLIVLGGGILWLFLGRAPIEEGRCKLKLKAVRQPDGLAGLAERFLDLPTSEGSHVGDLPDGFNQPFHYRVRAAGADVLLVVNGADPWTLCLDTNRDGRLSDEKPVRGKAMQIRGWPPAQRHYLFGPFELTFPDASGPRKASFHLLGYTVDISGEKKNEQPGTFAIYPACYRMGRLRIRGQIYKVAIIDGDYDGRFTPVTFLEKDPAGRLRCDYFAIDLNRDGKFQRELFRRGETGPLGRMVLVQGTYYAIDIGGNGQELALRPVNPEMGTLVLDRPDCEIGCQLWSDAADQWLDLASDQKERSLPAGKYTVARVEIRAQDSSRSTWETICAGKFGSLSLFEIKAGETTRLEMGPPFTVTPNVVKTDEGTVFIDPILTGRAGEGYSTVVRRNGQTVPAPALAILDEKGNVLVTDRFQYG
jgi:hypothetical protein